MANTSVLISLVQSLSKSEKRHFRLQAQLQKGSKAYLVLFGLLQKENNTAALKAAFQTAMPGASFDTTRRHLYKVITDSLLRLRMDQGNGAGLIAGLLKASVLFEKSLHAEGFRILSGLQQQADQLGEPVIALWAARLELYHQCNLNFHYLTEANLVQKQMKAQALIRQLSAMQQHLSLYELLRHRSVHKGHVRNAQQKTALSDLAVAELSWVSGHADTLNTHKTHLLFQAHYFIAINDYPSALLAFYELNDLFDRHPLFWADKPLDYLSCVEGILDSLRTVHDYEGMNKFLHKLGRIDHPSPSFRTMVQRLIYVYTLAGWIDRGEFKRALSFMQGFEDRLGKALQVLDPEKQAEIHLYTALVHFGNDDMEKAHHHLSRVLLESRLYHHLPVYQTFRLIHLLVHFEMGNHDFIFHEIRSFRRKLKMGSPAGHRLEKIIFRFIQMELPFDQLAACQAAWGKLSLALDDIRGDRYEIQILKIFDFSAWIEARICRKSFSAVLKKQFSTAILQTPRNPVPDGAN